MSGQSCRLWNAGTRMDERGAPLYLRWMAIVSVSGYERTYATVEDMSYDTLECGALARLFLRTEYIYTCRRDPVP